MITPPRDAQGMLLSRTGQEALYSSRGLGLAIDVAVICPLADSNRNHESPCDTYAMGKIAKYGEQFEGSGYDFAPLILETSGGISTGGEDVLKQIFRFAAKQQGERYACFASQAWRRLSCTLMNSVAQMILNRSNPKETKRKPDFGSERKRVRVRLASLC